MAETYSREELNEARFTQLIFTFQAAAMQQMGKLINPLTGKVEKNMEQAKRSIDIVAMLEEKTKGNLNEREKKLIEGVLFELRMNYLDELKVVEEQKQREPEKAAEREEEKTQKEEKKAKAKKVGKRPKKSSIGQKAKSRKRKTN